MKSKPYGHKKEYKWKSVFLYWLSLFIATIVCACGGHSEGVEEEHEDEHEAHSHEGIVMEPEEAEKFGIEYEKVEPGSFRDVIKTSGTIETFGSDIYTITARRSGRITLAPGMNVGSMIGQGARVASLSSEGLEGGDVNLAARANLMIAKAEYERLRPLYEDNLVTAATFKEAERAYREAEALAGIQVAGSSGVENSPVAGTLTDLYVTSGQYVEMGAPIATVAKNTRLTLKADLPARYASRVATIETANFRPEGSEDIISIEELDGNKISGGSVSASSGGYVPVYFSFSGNSQSHPGGYAEVYLLGKKREGVVSVPRGALLELQGNKYVYVVHEGHSYEKRLVTTGQDTGERVEIKEGLLPGEEIVAKGASIIRMVEVSAVAPPSHTHNH